MNRRSRIFGVRRATVIVLGMICLQLCNSSGRGQPPDATKVPVEATAKMELNAEAIQARLIKVQDNKDIDAALKTRLIELYGKILEQVKLIADANGRAERFAKQAREAPQSLPILQKELAEPVMELPLELPAGVSLTQAQQRLSQIETELSEAQRILKDLQDEPKRRADRRVEIPKLSETSKTQLQELETQLQVKPAADEPVELATANRLLLEARRASLQAEGAAVQSELRFYETAGELLPVRRDLAARKVAQLDSLAKRLRDDVNERRRREAMRQAGEARRVAAQAHPALRAIADRNAELAKLREQLAPKIEAAAVNLDQLNKGVEQLTRQFEKVSKRVEAGQQNQSIGLLLRKQRDELPAVSSEREKIQRRSVVIANASVELIEYEEQRNDLATIDTRLEEVMEGLGADTTPEERTLLEDDVREMLETQRNYLDALIVDTNSYLDKLTELDARNQELVLKSKEYGAFFDERIFWIRSAADLTALSARDLAHAVRWLVAPGNWRQVLEAAWAQMTRHPWSTGLLGVVWVLALAARSFLKHQLTLAGDQAARGSCLTMAPTIRAKLLTIYLAAIWPALTGLLGLQLLASDSESEFSTAFGHGLFHMAQMFFGLELIRQLVRSRGLGEAHFGYDPLSLRKLGRLTFWTMVVALPLLLIVALTESQSNENYKNSLGRVSFLLLNLLLLLPAWRVTHPSSGFLSLAYQQDRQAWWSRLSWLWVAIGVAAPLSLAGLAASGFYYTANQLAERMASTVWLIVGLTVAYGLMLRWSLIAYRNLGKQRLEERRAAAVAEATSPSVATTAAPMANSQLQIKLADINQQTRATLQLLMAVALVAGVWWIWAAVVPALRALRHIVLWQLETRTGAEVVLTPITLADLALSVIVLALTIAIGRSIPSILELTLLKRLPLDAGARYATGTVARYVVTTVGVVAAFAALGVEWSQVQWLIAAISFGLGFGLQEIFANFISGLVLLFERPIRIGDIVMIGGIEGKVSNIRMRATTITDWDLRELVVPNKELVTGRVINCTLSTVVSRMTIDVGVASGTDPNRVRALLLEIAQKHPHVLKDPPPHALLDGFGDGQLAFVLRVYYPTRDLFLQLRHELMTEIANRFVDAGIPFAFPRRDVFLHGDATGTKLQNGIAVTDGLAPPQTTPREEPQRASAPSSSAASRN